MENSELLRHIASWIASGPAPYVHGVGRTEIVERLRAIADKLDSALSDRPGPEPVGAAAIAALSAALSDRPAAAESGDRCLTCGHHRAEHARCTGKDTTDAGFEDCECVEFYSEDRPVVEERLVGVADLEDMELRRLAALDRRLRDLNPAPAGSVEDPSLPSLRGHIASLRSDLNRAFGFLRQDRDRLAALEAGETDRRKRETALVEVMGHVPAALGTLSAGSVADHRAVAIGLNEAIQRYLALAAPPAAEEESGG